MNRGRRPKDLVIWKKMYNDGGGTICGVGLHYSERYIVLPFGLGFCSNNIFKKNENYRNILTL